MIRITSQKSLEQISTHELTQDYYKEKIGELIVKKRDNIPAPTVWAWYKDFKEKRGWTKEKFDEQFQKVMDNTTYGIIKIDDFLKEEKMYTEKEVENEVTNRVKNIISDANALLRHYKTEIELEFDVPVPTTKLKVAVAQKLLPLLQRAERETNLSIIDESFDIALENLQLELKSTNEGTGTRLKKRMGW